MADRVPAPICPKCAKPIAGARVPGNGLNAAGVPVCGVCATAVEGARRLRRLLEKGSVAT